MIYNGTDICQFNDVAGLCDTFEATFICEYIESPVTTSTTTTTTTTTTTLAPTTTTTKASLEKREKPKSMKKKKCFEVKNVA